MAGDWIPLRDNIHDDPDVFRIASSLKVRDTDTIVGKVTRFWAWASEHSRDGSLPGVTFDFIDAVAKQRGLGEAMVAAGWLANDDGRLSIPNFDRWMSKGAKARLGETQRKQMSRVVPENVRKNSGQMSGQFPEECPEKNRTREEKRREEKKDNPLSLPAPSVLPAPTPPSVRDATGSAGRFLANRQNATGNAPEGFVAFVNAYPTGLALDDDGMLAIWRAKGLEEIRDEVLAGLARWNASEKFQTGHAPAATTFLTRGDWAKMPPPPKPAAKPVYGGGAF